jgi:tRNA threonylcarbamoyladenosine biosynthesis protein TsaE
VKKLERSITELNQLPEVAKDILNFSQGRRVFAFHGEMGSGKTTIIKQLCIKLGCKDNLSSPSYSIINEYLVEADEQKIYHIDLYRLKDIKEALSIGIEGYISGEYYCFIEWPELVNSLLPQNVINVSITHEDNMREISIFME